MQVEQQSDRLPAKEQAEGAMPPAVPANGSGSDQSNEASVTADAPANSPPNVQTTTTETAETNSPANSATAPNDRPDEPVVDLGERLRVLGLLGEGGMGSVYKIQERATGKVYAAKLLKSEFARDPSAVKRFEQEVTAASELTHPNLIFIYGSHRAADGTPYMVMNFVDGESLGQLLQFNNILTAQRALPIFQQVAKALEHVHSKNIIHRDLKPSNIIIYQHPTQKDAVRLVDFGIAKMQGIDTTGEMTQTGELFGSPYYMSPEQCGGERLDPRSDIYSLGCVMYQSLCGKPPFENDSAIKTMVAHMQSKPKPLRSVNRATAIPKSLEAVVMRCLLKDPDKRYQSAQALLIDLDSVAAGRNVAKTLSMPWTQKVSLPWWKLICMTACSFALGASCVHLVSKSDPSKWLNKNAPPVVAVTSAQTEHLSKAFVVNNSPTEIKVSGLQVVKNHLRPGNKELDLNRELTLGYTFTDEDLQPIASSHGLERIAVDCERLTDKGLAFLPGSSLKELALSYVPKKMDLKALQGFPHLKTLELSHGILGPEVMREIAVLPRLQELNLAVLELTDKHLMDLEPSPIISISIKNCTGITDAGWRSIAKLQHLGRLKVEKNDLPAATIAWLEHALPKVKLVVISPTIPKGLPAAKYMNMAVQYKQEGDPQQARAALDLAIESGDRRITEQAELYKRTRLPRFSVPSAAQHLNLAGMKHVAADRARAERDWKECIDKYPEFEWPYFNLANFYLEDKRTRDAEALLKKVLLLNPDYLNALGAMASLKIDQGDYNSANNHLDRIQALEPDNRSLQTLRDRLKKAQMK